MQAPWYFGATQPTLKHQREPAEWKKDYTKMDVWYKKGVDEVMKNCITSVIAHSNLPRVDYWCYWETRGKHIFRVPTHR